MCPEDDKNAAPCSKCGTKGFFSPKGFFQSHFQGCVSPLENHLDFHPRVVNAAGCRAKHRSITITSYITATQEGVNHHHFHASRWKGDAAFPGCGRKRQAQFCLSKCYRRSCNWAPGRQKRSKRCTLLSAP